MGAPLEYPAEPDETAHPSNGAMTSFDELLSQVPVLRIAERLGLAPDTASTTVHATLPTLLGGLQSIALRPEGAATLREALADHAGIAPDTNGVELDTIDTDKGAEAVDTIFGADKPTVITALGENPETADSAAIARLLPLLAPIALAYVARQLNNGGQASMVLTQLLNERTRAFLGTTSQNC